MNPLEHVIYKFINTPVRGYPFSHIFIEDVFPRAFYDKILANLPKAADYASNGTHYNGRKFADPTTNETFSFLQDQAFLRAIIHIFLPDFKKRFGDSNLNVTQDLRLILDGENYSIGPHTDAPWKIVSLLFYLPPDNGLRDLGTSIYLPKERSFHCKGGPHYNHSDYDLVYTAPFLPNTCFGFFKTDYSFHGVEPIKMACRRDVLLWNLYDSNTPRR